MKDQYDREIDYMRISVTDRCNLRCKYCMPEGVPLTEMKELLTFEEIAETVSAAAVLGIHHIKLTGGEPLIRRGLPDLVRMLKEIDGIDRVTLTTNGILLRDRLPALIESGLDAVNISLDTTDPAIFKNITGADAAEEVLSALDFAVSTGIRTKINAVSLDLGGENLRNLLRLAKDRPVDVRFIEMMPIGLGRKYPVLDHRKLLAILRRMYPGMTADPSQHGFGPAVYYSVPGFQGSIGLISAIHGKFCSSCNRVRLTSTGYLKTCLCYHDGVELKPILRSGMPEEQKRSLLCETMRNVIYRKPRQHCFEEIDHVTEPAAMNMIGG
ncbi:MAG: GTP 3',8-cyclase MoaA [Blautia sp.]|nr:GTP 3',8-cyclase MoaA [Lachnospiraceae bacterium]MBP3902118.1 GTP 3',8-cyclase MoaA [Blautia sp.]